MSEELRSEEVRSYVAPASRLVEHGLGTRNISWNIYDVETGEAVLGPMEMVTVARMSLFSSICYLLLHWRWPNRDVSVGVGPIAHTRDVNTLDLGWDPDPKRYKVVVHA